MTMTTTDRVRVSLQQVERLLLAIDDLRTTVLPQNPELFATLAEGPLDELQRIQAEIRHELNELAVLQSA